MIFLRRIFSNLLGAINLERLNRKEKTEKGTCHLRRAGAYIFAVLRCAIPFDDPKVA